MDRRELLEYIRLRHNYMSGYKRWQELPSSVRNRALNRATNKYENFIKTISRKYRIPNNQRQPIPGTPTVAFLEYERRKFERQVSRKPSSTPVKTPGKKSRVPPSTPRSPYF